MRKCSIVGCTREYRARGYCITHYTREFKYGIGANAQTIYDPRATILKKDYALIPLGVGNKKFTIVDLEYAWLGEYKWSTDKRGYAVSNLKGKHRKIHQEIMGGKKEGFDIDHIDRNPLNNRKSNLRYVTHQENSWNAGMFSHNTSGHKGVTRDKARDKWMAKIMLNKKTINLGRYDLLEDAVKARKEAELKYWIKGEMT